MDIAGSSQFELEDGQIAETTHNNPRNAPPGQNVPNIPSVPNVSNTPIEHITQNNDAPNIKHVQVSDLSAVASTINPLDSQKKNWQTWSCSMCILFDIIHTRG